MKLAYDPPVSEAQRRAMWAAAKGKSTLGIPKKVGKEFVGDAATRAAGIIFAASTGNVLWLKRSDAGDHPGEWCFPGGRLENDETPLQAALREAEEELNYIPEGTPLELNLAAGDAGVEYTTYLQQCDGEFAVKLDNEHVAWGWAPLDDPPQPVHPAIALMLSEQQANDMALDRASIREVDKDGHLHVGLTNISKANVCKYYGREIPSWQKLGLEGDKEYRLYRHPEELEKGAKTFDGKPLLFKHKATSADDHQTDLTVGAVKNPEWRSPYLMAELDIWPSEAIKAIESGEQRELSCGYRYEPDMTPGVTDRGETYDGVMRNIIGNHVALVEEGRAGPDVVVGDSMAKDAWSPEAREAAIKARQANAKGGESKEATGGAGEKRNEYVGKLNQISEKKKTLTSKLTEIEKAKGGWKQGKEMGPEWNKLNSEANELAQQHSKLLNEYHGFFKKSGLKKEEFGKGLASGHALDDGLNLQPNSAIPSGIKKEKKMAKIGKDAELKNFLKGKIGEDDYKTAVSMMRGAKDEKDDDDDKKDKTEDENKDDDDKKDKPAVDAEEDDDNEDDDEDTEEQREEKERLREEKEKLREAKDKRGAKDKRMGKDAPGEQKDVVTTKAMDSAMAALSTTLKKTARATREAERDVHQYVGELAMDHDSPEEVYQNALKSMGVKVDPGWPLSALQALMHAQPKPGQRSPRKSEMATDSKTPFKYEDMFPGAERIGHSG